MCCACRERADKSQMLRVVKTTNGEIVIDESQRMDGRGVWLHDSDACKAKAVKRKLFNVAFKTCVSEEIYEQIKGE
ncbi:MAG: YlxR family protein [Bacteroides sp.]|nr:YlxR family protein [Bacillota bacterium]MCM1393860.1 YlxR family protein [[Eubacterium] siraeum]MCM1455803.1 YlxR family protein [Bacteroides sp.]